MPDYVKESVNTAVKIHEREEKGDILVFLTGQDEVDRAVTLLRQHSDEMKGRVPRKLFLSSSSESESLVYSD